MVKVDVSLDFINAMAVVNLVTTVDGRNAAPVDMVNIPLFTGFYTSQVQYHKPLQTIVTY